MVNPTDADRSLHRKKGKIDVDLSDSRVSKQQSDAYCTLVIRPVTPTLNEDVLIINADTRN